MASPSWRLQFDVNWLILLSLDLVNALLALKISLVRAISFCTNLDYLDVLTSLDGGPFGHPHPAQGKALLKLKEHASENQNTRQIRVDKNYRVRMLE